MAASRAFGVVDTLDPALWADLVGEPYVHNGRGENGYDCFGLLLEVYKRRGIIIPDVKYGEDRAEHARLLALRAESQWKPCPVKPGAGLLFLEDAIPGHVGVALDEDRFIHASEAMKQVTVGRLSRLFGLKLISAYEPI